MAGVLWTWSSSWTGIAAKSWQVTNILDSHCSIAALEEAIDRYSALEIFNPIEACSSPVKRSLHCSSSMQSVSAWTPKGC
jgi:hypothetical protein